MRVTCPLRSTGITPLHRYFGAVRPWRAHRYFRPRGSTAWAFSLGKEIQQRVLDLIGLAVIGEAGGEPSYDSGSLLQFLQHQRPAIGGDVTTIEAPNQLPSAQFLWRFQRLSQRVEPPWSCERRDDQSHVHQDAGRDVEVTSFSKCPGAVGLSFCINTVGWNS